MKEQIVTVQKTSKGIKLASALGGLLFVFGIIGVIGSKEPNAVAALMVFFGAATWVVAKVKKWWSHD